MEYPSELERGISGPNVRGGEKLKKTRGIVWLTLQFNPYPSGMNDALQSRADECSIDLWPTTIST